MQISHTFNDLYAIIAQNFLKSQANYFQIHANLQLHFSTFHQTVGAALVSLKFHLALVLPICYYQTLYQKAVLEYPIKMHTPYMIMYSVLAELHNPASSVNNQQLFKKSVNDGYPNFLLFCNISCQSLLPSASVIKQASKASFKISPVVLSCKPISET